MNQLFDYTGSNVYISIFKLIGDLRGDLKFDDRFTQTETIQVLGRKTS